MLTQFPFTDDDMFDIMGSGHTNSDDQQWITVNGAHIPLKEGGGLSGSVGEKIEAGASQSQSEMSEEIGIPPEKLAGASKVGTIPKERIKHISTGTWEDGQLKSGCHSQKGFTILQNQGLLSDVKTLPNGVRIANVKGHPDKSKSKSQGQTFFPENWGDNKISMSVKEIWRNHVDSISNTGYSKFTDWYDGVKITVGFKDSQLINAYPEKYQK